MISSFVSPALLDVQLEAVPNGVQEVTMLKKLLVDSVLYISL